MTRALNPTGGIGWQVGGDTIDSELLIVRTSIISAKPYLNDVFFLSRSYFNSITADIVPSVHRALLTSSIPSTPYFNSIYFSDLHNTTYRKSHEDK
jgi:hypothetical protein